MRRILRFSPLLLIVSSLIIIIIITPTPVQAQANLPEKFMVFEKVDLYLDGSITPVIVNLTEPFDHVMRFVWNLIWRDNVVDFDVFGTLAVPLTNGTEVSYNGTTLQAQIKSIKDFGTLSYDVRIDQDDKNPKDNHLYSRLSFWKFVSYQEGLDVHDYTLQFQINDNITDACSDFFVMVEGYRLVYPEVAAIQFPLNPFDYFNRWGLWALTQPLIWLMIGISFAVIIFIFRKMT